MPKTHELDRCMIQINAYRADRMEIPLALIERFREIAKTESAVTPKTISPALMGRIQENAPQAASDYLNEIGTDIEVCPLLLHAAYLKHSGAVLEAFDLFDRALRRWPEHAGLQEDWIDFLAAVVSETEGRLLRDPWDMQAAAIYERLVEVGDVTIKTHATMVEHYRLVGKINKAKDLAARVGAIAPNCPGLKETMERLKKTASL